MVEVEVEVVLVVVVVVVDIMVVVEVVQLIALLLQLSCGPPSSVAVRMAWSGCGEVVTPDTGQPH